MKGKFYTFVVGFICLAALAGGCRKQKSTLQTVPAEKPAVDSAFSNFKAFNVDTSDEAVFREAQLAEDLALRAKEALKTIYFDYNSFNLTGDATGSLASAAYFLKDNPGIRVLIQGHCDERGSSDYNMGLGERRAKAVKDYLENFGIPSFRMEFTSLGKEQPAIAGCSDEQCHYQNRRSEFRVLAR